MDLASMFSGLFGGGSSGGITYPEPTQTGDPNVLTGLPGVPATPDIYGGGNTTMPPGTYPTQSQSQSQSQFNPWSLLPSAMGGVGSLIGLIKGQGGATDKALKAQAQSTQGLQNAGNQALASYSSGTLTPTQQAAVDQKKQQELAQWRQYFARAGIPESSAMADAEAKVNQDSLVYQNQLLQDDFNNAYQAIGMSRGNLADLAKQQALQDTQQRQAWQDFMKALGTLGTNVGPIFNSGNP